MPPYILAFQSAREIKQHLSALLDVTHPSTQKFLKEFFVRWKPRSTDTYRLYKKDEPIGCLLTEKKGTKLSKPAKSPSSTEKTETVSSAIPTEIKNPNRIVLPGDENQRNNDDEEDGDCSTGSKETKFREETSDRHSPTTESVRGAIGPFKPRQLTYVPPCATESKTDAVILIEGRRPCMCQGQKHKLIDNCHQCGRIVCTQEGAGPCMFCDSLVCSKEDREVLERSSKKSKKLLEKLTSATYEEPSLQTDNGPLLEFEKSVNSPPNYVVDDEEENLSSNQWLSQEKREALAKFEEEIHQKKHKSRLENKIVLDIAGGKVVDIRNQYPSNDSCRNNASTVAHVQKNERNEESCNPMVDPRLKVSPPRFITPSQSDTVRSKEVDEPTSPITHPLRVQDDRLQYVVDGGVCLSLHQPWASLLVYGIKMLEGRNWYTSHRGKSEICSLIYKLFLNRSS